MSNTVKLVALSSVMEAKDGRNYYVATFSAGFGQKVVKRTFWQQFRNDPKTGLPTEEKYWERGSYEEAKALLKSGEAIEGSKITRNVETYSIGERDVNTYSTVIFPDENEYTLFNSQNHPIVNEDGEVVKPKVVLTLSTEEEEEEEVIPAPSKS